ncbi:UNVERIFIED_CONTAM: hypothetical protein FKN15_053323 [Acipenser sinensis]
MYKQWCSAMDQGKIPSEIKALLTGDEHNKAPQSTSKPPKNGKNNGNNNGPYKNDTGNITNVRPAAALQILF